jgi:hypothetical protein
MTSAHNRKMQPSSGPAGRAARASGALKIGKAVIAERYRSFNRAERRLADICRLIESRYGPMIPEHDEPLDPFVFTMANAVLASSGQTRAIERLTRLIARFEPWRTPHARYAAEAINKLKYARLVSDAKAGELLRLTLAKREALGITTISPFDLTADQFKACKQEKKRAADRARDARKRAESGAMTRQKWLEKVNSSSCRNSKPWLASGVSRATWYRREREKKRSIDQSVSEQFDAENGSETRFLARVETGMALLESHGFASGKSNIAESLGTVEIGTETCRSARVKTEVRPGSSHSSISWLERDTRSLTAVLFFHSASLLKRESGQGCEDAR